MRRPSRTAKRPSSSVGSSVQSQREALTQTGRTSTPCACGVADDLRRRVEAHRLGVEERGAEDVRMPAFHPGRGIGDQRERGGVAFRKSVAAEAFELPEGLLGELLLVAVGDHAGDELVA